MAEQLETPGFVELNVQTLGTAQGVSELNRMLQTIFNSLGADTQNVRIFRGYGTPESNIAAQVGSLYLRQDGGASTVLYVKETGDGDTGWVAK